MRTAGPKCIKKSLNGILAALPIRIFGGSPISVVVPPMFESKITLIKKIFGLIFKLFATTKATGTIRSTVVTLSKNAENTAVINPNKIKIGNGFPFPIFDAHIAIYWNIPHSFAIPTITIIPTSRPRVLKSIPSIAFSWFSMPSKIISVAPDIEMTVL